MYHYCNHIIYPRDMVRAGYVIVSTLHKGGGRDDDKFDDCMTVDHQNNNIDNQLDATITVY